MVPDRLGLMCNDRYYVVRRVGRRLANLFVMLMRSLQYDVRIYSLLQSSCKNIGSGSATTALKS